MKSLPEIPYIVITVFLPVPVFITGTGSGYTITNKYDSGVNLYLEKQQDNITRGHSLKLVNNRYQYDLRKFSFAPRIVNVWNSLPEIVKQSKAR